MYEWAKLKSSRIKKTQKITLASALVIFYTSFYRGIIVISSSTFPLLPPVALLSRAVGLLLHSPDERAHLILCDSVGPLEERRADHAASEYLLGNVTWVIARLIPFKTIIPM